MLRSIFTLALGGVLLVPVSAQVPAPVPGVTVDADARSLQPGEIVRFTITTATATDHLAITAFDRAVTPFKIDDRTWQALIGIDLDAPAGPVLVTITPSAPVPATAVVYRLVVKPKAFPTRRLTVNPDFVTPPPAVEARIEAEAKELTAIWKSSPPTRLWTDAFVRPVPQAANSAFGTRSVFNGEVRSPHGGADFASPEGTPVRAPGGGRIVLAKPLYYTGNTVVLDHGLGLMSLFAHFSAISVHEGDVVTAGTVLGRVGATGRVTGPHLHWTLRADGARVDPLSLLAIMGTAAPRR